MTTRGHGAVGRPVPNKFDHRQGRLCHQLQNDGKRSACPTRRLTSGVLGERALPTASLNTGHGEEFAALTMGASSDIV